MFNKLIRNTNFDAYELSSEANSRIALPKPPLPYSAIFNCNNSGKGIENVFNLSSKGQTENHNVCFLDVFILAIERDIVIIVPFDKTAIFEPAWYCFFPITIFHTSQDVSFANLE
jgi:hypothetical protein